MSNSKESLIVLDTPEQIAAYRYLAMRGALHLETKGMKMSRGVSIYALCKKDLGFKGTKESVLRQLENWLEDSGLTLSKRYTTR